MIASDKPLVGSLPFAGAVSADLVAAGAEGADLLPNVNEANGFTLGSSFFVSSVFFSSCFGSSFFESTTTGFASNVKPPNVVLFPASVDVGLESPSAWEASCFKASAAGVDDLVPPN